MYRRRRRRFSPITGALCIMVAVLALGGIVACTVAGNKDSTVVVRVTGKESVSTQDGHEYRVYTDKGTFKMGDSLFKVRFRTSDEYGRLIPGHTYQCKTWGFRVPVFSSFKNIRDCVEVGDGRPQEANPA